MPKVINQDIIDKIAEYAKKNYSKSATARELGIDPATVRKYWPQAEEPDVEKQEEKAKPKLSIEEEFDLLTKRKETLLELESIEFKIEDIGGETEDLRARREVILDQIKLLEQKLNQAESVIEVDKVQELVAKVKGNVTVLLAEDEPLHKQREEQQEKERREREEKERKKLKEARARRNKGEQSLRRVILSRFAWAFPCTREQAEKIMNTYIFKVDVNDNDPIISSLRMVNKQLSIAEELKWEDNTSGIKPLITECVNLLDGNSGEKQRIMVIMHARKERILIPSDEDVRIRLVDLLTAKANVEFVEMVLKFNAALSRLAEERFIDKQELLSKETP